MNSYLSVGEESLEERALLKEDAKRVVSNNKEHNKRKQSIVVEVFIKQVKTFVRHHSRKEEIVAENQDLTCRFKPGREGPHLLQAKQFQVVGDELPVLLGDDGFVAWEQL